MKDLREDTYRLIRKAVCSYSNMLNCILTRDTSLEKDDIVNDIWLRFTETNAAEKFDPARGSLATFIWVYVHSRLYLMINRPKNEDRLPTVSFDDIVIQNNKGDVLFYKDILPAPDQKVEKEILCKQVVALYRKNRYKHLTNKKNVQYYRYKKEDE